MSPTLLEGVAIIFVIIVAWKIGIQIAPLIFRGLRHAADEVEQASEEANKPDPSTTIEGDVYDPQHHDH